MQAIATQSRRRDGFAQHQGRRENDGDELSGVKDTATLSGTQRSKIA
jgi:hypothetical protein